MSENTAEEPIAIEAAPAVSQPVVGPPVVSQPVVVAPVAKQSHTRTILEIVGAAIAVALIFLSGVAGFVLGHVTAKHDGRDDRGGMSLRIERGEQGFPGGPNSQSAPSRPDFQQGPSDAQGTQPFAPQE